MDKMKDFICNAHMAGQMDAGCKEPSWSNAHAYYSSMKEELKSFEGSVDPAIFMTIKELDKEAWYNSK